MYNNQTYLLQRNLQKVQNTISMHTKNLTREPILIAVSKYHQPQTINMLFNIGVNNFAENFVQEAIPKIKFLPSTIIWHYIGIIQSNKITKIARHFHWVHALNSLTHAKRLNNQCKVYGKKMRVLIQINIDLDPCKSGVLLHNQTELHDLILGIEQNFSNLSLQGFSCMLANTGNYNQQYNSFIKMYKLIQNINSAISNNKLMHLSMGTSSDIKAALQSGSTMLRIGKAIFGNYL